MTEDDTFRVLSRTPYREMENIFVRWIQTTEVLTWREDVHKLMKQHGWTYEGFNEYRTRKSFEQICQARNSNIG